MAAAALDMSTRFCAAAEAEARIAKTIAAWTPLVHEAMGDNKRGWPQVISSMAAAALALRCTMSQLSMLVMHCNAGKTWSKGFKLCCRRSKNW
jgi:negative regulator of sigma E activity